MGGIVVGIDGSADADAALEWSMAQARSRQCPLTVLLAWDPQHCPPAVTGMAGLASEHDTEAAAYRVLHTAIRRAADPRRPTALVEKVERGDAGKVLQAAAAEADLLVLGLHGANRKHRLLAGSVTERLLHRTGTTTVVVRAGAARLDGPVAGPVVVGVDGSDASIRALRQAVIQARAQQAVLRVVHAWLPTYMMDPDALAGVDATVFEKSAQAVLDDCLDQVHEDTLGLRVEPVLVADAPGRVLVRQSADASLVVVGSRGRGELAELMLGSVSHRCVHHAACPVAVVH